MTEIRIVSESVNDFFDGARAKAAALDAGELSAEASMISFESMDMLLKVLTPNRWRLLRCLKGEGPLSIRKLSQRLARDYSGVHADCVALLDTGLINKTPGGEIFVPWQKITAEISLDAAA